MTDTIPLHVREAAKTAREFEDAIEKVRVEHGPEAAEFVHDFAVMLMKRDRLMSAPVALAIAWSECRQR